MPAKLILIQGKSGTGKSTSWENMPHEECAVIRPNTKDLPFPGARTKYQEGKNIFTTNKITDIPTILAGAVKRGKKYILIDDLTHFMNARVTSQEFIQQGKTKDAFSRWNVLAADVARIVIDEIDEMPDDVYVFINGHTETNEDGDYTLKTAGKMLENSIDLPSYFTYIFHTMVEDKDDTINYYLLTNKYQGREAKTPRGCFTDLRIPNDAKLIVEKIEQYQNA